MKNGAEKEFIIVDVEIPFEMQLLTTSKNNESLQHQLHLNTTLSQLSTYLRVYNTSPHSAPLTLLYQPLSSLLHYLQEPLKRTETLHIYPLFLIPSDTRSLKL
jgi:hypothetical protein